MPLGFDHPHPGGMADNSPTFEHVGCAGLDVHKSLQGRLNPCEIGQSSFQDLSCCGRWFPTFKTFGYSRMSLRDKGLDRFLGPSLGSNPSGIGHSCPPGGPGQPATLLDWLRVEYGIEKPK